jgi:hypothetical protein
MIRRLFGSNEDAHRCRLEVTDSLLRITLSEYEYTCLANFLFLTDDSFIAVTCWSKDARFLPMADE